MKPVKQRPVSLKSKKVKPGKTKVTVEEALGLAPAITRLRDMTPTELRLVKEQLESIRSWMSVNDTRCIRYEAQRELRDKFMGDEQLAQRALLEELMSGVRLLLRHAGRQMLAEARARDLGVHGNIADDAPLAQQLREQAERLRAGKVT